MKRMKNKILFLDIDNTLMFPDTDKYSLKITGESKNISKKTISLLKDLQKQYYIVLATGRRFSNYERLKCCIPLDYAIIEHGALIFGEKQDMEWADSLKRVIGSSNTRSGTLWEYEKMLSKTLNIESSGRYGSFRLDPRQNAGMTQADLEQKIKDLPEELTYVRNEAFVDIIPKDATKVHAMKYLAKKLGVKWTDTFFVGDDYNDADALKEISHPYTHSGATPKIIELVKKREGYVSPKSSFDGINDILLRIKDNHY